MSTASILTVTFAEIKHIGKAKMGDEIKSLVSYFREGRGVLLRLHSMMRKKQLWEMERKIDNIRNKMLNWEVRATFKSANRNPKAVLSKDAYPKIIRSRSGCMTSL